MEKCARPASFGVFKPEHHVVIALPSKNDADACERELRQAGFGDICGYTPDEMIEQADVDILRATTGAQIGQELNLVKAHRELAAKGHHFVVVRASKHREVERVAEIARQCRATRAQAYGTLIIEELIDVGDGLSQVGESPDRGLDSQTPSGHEPAPDRRQARP